MTFNVLGCNVDDHSKNFAFLMDKNGKWNLAPAYDILFTVDLDGPKYLNSHSLPIGIKTHDIGIGDLRHFAEENDILKADGIIDEVRESLSKWEIYAREAGVPEKWTNRIAEELNQQAK